jgi:hypothetical protein
MRHGQYIEFFETCAREHKDILHKDEKHAFATIIESAPNPFKGTHDIEDFLAKIRTKGKFPMLLLVSFEADYNVEEDISAFKIINGAFVVLDIPTDKKKYTDINIAIDKTERIGEDILNRLHYWASENECTLVYNEATASEKIGPIADDFYGTKFYFKILANAMHLLRPNINDSSIWDI